MKKFVSIFAIFCFVAGPVTVSAADAIFVQSGPVQKQAFSSQEIERFAVIESQSTMAQNITAGEMTDTTTLALTIVFVGALIFVAYY